MESIYRAAALSPTGRASGSWATQTYPNSAAGICTTCSTIPGKMELRILKSSVEYSSPFDLTRALMSTTKSFGARMGPASQPSIGPTQFAAAVRSPFCKAQQRLHDVVVSSPLSSSRWRSPRTKLGVSPGPATTCGRSAGIRRRSP